MKKITGRMTAIAASLALTASAVSLSVSALNRKKGDVTGDGKVTQADAVWAARKADGQDIGDVSFDELAADVDFNGKFDSADAQAIAKYVAGWNDTSVGDSITESDPVYTLSIKYRDDIDKSVQNAEFAAAIANDNDFITALSNDSELEEAVGESDELLELYLEEKYEELLILLLNEHEGVMDVILDGEFDDMSDFTKVKSGLTLEEAYALALKFPDFNVDIDAGGEKAPMIITEDIDGYTNDENITSVTLTAKVVGGKAPYTYKWYKAGSEVGTNATYTSGVTGDNFDKEVYCLITDADGKTLETNKTVLKNVELESPLKICYEYGGNEDNCKQTHEKKSFRKYETISNGDNVISVTMNAIFKGGSGYITDFDLVDSDDPDEQFVQFYDEKVDPSRYSYKITLNQYQRGETVIAEGNLKNELFNKVAKADYEENGYLYHHIHHVERIQIPLTILYDELVDKEWIEHNTQYTLGEISYYPPFNNPNYYYPKYNITLTDNVTGLSETIGFSSADYELHKGMESQN